MNTIIVSISGPVFEWVISNIPELGILLVIGFFIWKSVSWLNGRFEKYETRMMNFMNEALSRLDTSLRAEISNSEKNLRAELTTFKEQTAANFLHMEKVMDMRFDRLEKRMDKSEENIENLFESQHKTDLAIVELKQVKGITKDL